MCLYCYVFTYQVNVLIRYTCALDWLPNSANLINFKHFVIKMDNNNDYRCVQWMSSWCIRGNVPFFCRSLVGVPQFWLVGCVSSFECVFLLYVIGFWQMSSVRVRDRLLCKEKFVYLFYKMFVRGNFITIVYQVCSCENMISNFFNSFQTKIRLVFLLKSGETVSYKILYFFCFFALNHAIVF